MANGYSFEREGNGYRFFPDAAQSAPAGNRPFWSGDGPIWLALLLIIFIYFTQDPAMRLGAVVLTCVLLYMRFKGSRSATELDKAPRRAGGFLVTREAITTPSGEVISASRINSVDISNEFDDYLSGRSGSPTYYQAGSGLAAAEAIGHQRRLNSSKIRFVVSVQHGPGHTVLAKKLSQSGAAGLRADIGRVLKGEGLS